METLFTYETAKHTLVMTGYFMIILLDCWWLGYIIVSTAKWCFKKIKAIIVKCKEPKTEATDEVTHEQ